MSVFLAQKSEEAELGLSLVNEFLIRRHFQERLSDEGLKYLSRLPLWERFAAGLLSRLVRLAVRLGDILSVTRLCLHSVRSSLCMSGGSWENTYGSTLGGTSGTSGAPRPRSAALSSPCSSALLWRCVMRSSACAAGGAELP